jgi:hypothetical protein
MYHLLVLVYIYIFAYLFIYFLRRRDSVVGIATGYGLDYLGGRSSSPGRVKNFRISMSFRSPLESTRPPIQWARGALSRG